MIDAQNKTTTLYSYQNGIGANTEAILNRTLRHILYGDLYDGGGNGGNGGDEHWDKVVALLHFDGDLNDETGRVWNAVGNPTISNGELILDGSSGLTTSAAGFDFGTGDFTIEAFLRQTSPNSQWREIFMANAGYGINTMLYDKNLAIGREGVAIDYVSTDLAPQDTLIHLALSRVAGVVKGFINGTQVFSGSYTYDFSSTALHSLGVNSYAGNVNGLVGAIESFRVTKGVGRYTANFTPEQFKHY